MVDTVTTLQACTDLIFIDDQPNVDQNVLNDQSALPKTTPSTVPKLIDNKRKHLERNLSAAKRDALFLEESKNDKIFRKELTDAIKESTVSMAQALQGISQSMVQVSTVLGKSIEFMAGVPSTAQNGGYFANHQNGSHPFNPSNVYHGSHMIAQPPNLQQHFSADFNFTHNT